MTSHRVLVRVCVIATLVLAACSARGEDDEASDTVAPATDAPSPATTAAPPTTSGGPTASTAPGSSTPTDTATATTAAVSTPATEPQYAEPLSAENFGTLASPCGEGEATVDEDQNGGDTLKLAVANDAENDFSPGLTKEMLDAGRAFAEWCNEHGGIQGLEIEVVNMDGGIFNAAAAMEAACDEAFAMVGGGLVLDDQTFPRFHECGMVDFSGYTVTSKKADSNGKVQPIPNPPNVKPSAWLTWGAEAYPDAVKNTVLFYQDVATVKIVSDQLAETMEAEGWNVRSQTAVGLGEANWTPFAQQVKDAEAGAVSISGQPGELVQLVKALEAVDYQPELILQEVNFYDSDFPEQAGEAGEGVAVRMAYAPFEEPENYPGMAAYLEMMETYNPDGKIAGLGVQATSAHLMFATAANACIDGNDGVLERECVLAEGLTIREWDGGGLHAPTDPASNEPPSCTIIMQVQDGDWTRLFPEYGGPDDDGDGFACEDPGITETETDFGDPSGVDRDRPN